MELTCRQVETLLAFYIDGDLNNNLRFRIENHLKECHSCMLKYDTLKTLIDDFESSYKTLDKVTPTSTPILNDQYKVFKSNLSAYLDNELSDDENIKVKKYTINNAFARKELENMYTLRKLMNNCFEKTKNEMKHDFSKTLTSESDLFLELNKMDPFLKVVSLITMASTACIILVTIFIWI